MRPRRGTDTAGRQRPTTDIARVISIPWSRHQDVIDLQLRHLDHDNDNPHLSDLRGAPTMECSDVDPELPIHGVDRLPSVQIP